MGPLMSDLMLIDPLRDGLGACAYAPDVASAPCDYEAADPTE
jgi:hypothetical protein